MATEHADAPPPKPRRRGPFRSIQSRLAAVMSVVFAAVIVVIELLDFFGIPFIPYSGRWGEVKWEAIKDVNLIADLKAERLRAWVADARKDVRVLATNATRTAQTVALTRSIRTFEEQGLRGTALWSRVRQQSEYIELVARLKEINAAYPDYRRVFIADLQRGAIVACSDDADLGSNVHEQAFVTRPRESDEARVGNVMKVTGFPDPVFHISRLLSSAGTAIDAVLVAEVRAEDLLPPLLHAGEEERETEDSVLVNREGDILTPLKHPAPDGSVPKPLEYRILSEPAQRAAHGESGTVEAPDYRGVPVVAAIRFLQITPELGWGLVVKRDRSEVMAPLRVMALRHLGIAAAGIFVVVLLSITVARGVTRPLRALAQTAQRVAEGDLTCRAPVTTNDEVGTLATTFNGMIDRIQESQVALLRQERLAALGRLTATVSHEIRNPLGTIRTSTFIIAQRIRGKGLGTEPSLERIERSIVRCDGIIADLLDFSRNRPIETQPTDFDLWLAALLDEQEIPAHVTVVRDLAAGVTVPLDQERFRRCVINLVTNACQAMDNGDGRLTVSTRRDGGRLLLRVADTGCGISPEGLQRIFEPLYSTKNFGVGLGLAIVQQIVSQHQGGIDVESQVGHGTTFTVWLPLAKEEVASG